MATQVSQSASSMASRNFFEPLALVRSPTTRNEVSWVEGDLGVDRRRPVLGLRDARRPGEVGAGLHHRGQVLRRGAAAAADHRDAQLAHELAVELGQLVGVEVVVHGPVDHRGQPGVGQAGHREGAVAGEVAERLEHLGRAGGAVEPDEVDAHGLEGAQGGTDLGAGQHGAGQFDGDLGLDGQVHAGRLHGPAGAVDGRLGLQEVEDRLDDDEVDAALDEGRGLLLVGVPQVGVADLAEGGELGAGADAAGHPPGRSGVEKSSAAPRASAAAARLSSRTRWAWPYSASTGAKAPKVSVSTTSQPTSKNDRWIWSTASGRVTTSSSLQPSRSGPPKSSAVRFGQLQVGAHGAVEDDHPLGGGLEIAGGRTVGAVAIALQGYAGPAGPRSTQGDPRPEPVDVLAGPRRVAGAGRLASGR